MRWATARWMLVLGALGAASCTKTGASGGGTQLPVDCRSNDRVTSVADSNPNCAVASGQAPGTIGGGAPLGDSFFAGFVDGSHVIFTNGDVLGTLRAVYSLDPATKVRTVISGTYLDPRMGSLTVGSGPTISEVWDAAKGPDGYYFFVDDSDHTTGTWETTTWPDPVIVRVDPATGTRTEALDFGAAGATCTTRSGIAMYPNKARVAGDVQSYLSFDIGPDGTIYVGVQHQENALAHTWGGVAAFRGGHCQLISVDDSQNTDEVGTGAQLVGSPSALRVSGNTVYLIPEGMYALMAVDIATGKRTIVSNDRTNVGSGPPVHQAYMQVAPDGALWTSGAGALTLDTLFCRIDPATGDRTGYDPHGNGGPHTGEPFYGFDPTRPFLYFGDNGNQLGVLEYTTGNYNLLAY